MKCDATLVYVEVKGLYGLTNIRAQLFPRIALRKNTLGETFGRESTHVVLRDFEDQLIHVTNVKRFRQDRQASPPELQNNLLK